MQALIFTGKQALTTFKQEVLLAELKAETTAIKDFNTHFVYFIESDKTLTDDILNKTKTLLDIKDQLNALKENQFFVIPRKGTISPWSSKATDIFHNCGIQDIIRVERGIIYTILTDASSISLQDIEPSLHLFFDKMTEEITKDVSDMFLHREPAPMSAYDILNEGISALKKANIEKGLALSNDEMEYLLEEYQKIKRNPTDVELLMFGQVNSEHCRHKIFNADWIIDGKSKTISLFKMIKHTHQLNPEGTLVAYNDNSSVIEGFTDEWFEPDFESKIYDFNLDQIDIIMKVETHNHPTAISPYPGAATGVGGEIRDEGATGTGSRSKAGLSAFMVSNLKVPEFIMPWEKEFADFPEHLATPLEIMIKGPIGGARFGNEFGRPQLTGIFKTYEQKLNDRYFGYHKPIMVAGGMGNIKRKHNDKKAITKNSYIIQIGGPALKIGVGGGAASSMDSGTNDQNLDFNSVQRDNAEMQRRCQEVINVCVSLDEQNPILSIHDIGAGGLSNASPELIAECGGEFWLRKIHNEESSMSPMEIWCSEAQERYVMAVKENELNNFLDICERERCPAAVYGKATNNGHLSLIDDHFKNKPIDIDLKVILGKPPKMLKDVIHYQDIYKDFSFKGINLEDAVERVLHLPAVADKTFLITIADRSITGMVARDQMIGPYQTPVSDAAVTTTTLKSFTGEAMAMGERTSLALINAEASGRMAIGEALTNILSTYVEDIKNIKLSANWMCACGEDGEDAKLFDTVKTVGMELCPQLGISIPVGKDSLSMRTIWNNKKGTQEKITSPLSLIVSAFSPVKDVRKTITPQLIDCDSTLILIDLGCKKNRMAGSALAQVYNQIGKECPDLDNPEQFILFFKSIQKLIAHDLILSYHDRSDGGLITLISEMCFTARLGVDLDVSKLGINPLKILFTEELGALIQVNNADLVQVKNIFNEFNIENITFEIGSIAKNKDLTISFNNEKIYQHSIVNLKKQWSELTYKMQSLRDNPECAKAEYENIDDIDNPGINFKLSFNPDKVFNIPENKPKMAILREQGINGHIEMAAAFSLAGFETIDLHMTDLLEKRVSLKDFSGLVACGGFSYGDVLGAGSGWARSILYNPYLRDMFTDFFHKKDTFALGVCNGCQMLSQLKDIIPGACNWPHFSHNISGQFEARYVLVKIIESPSIFFKGMENSQIAIPVAHGEGLADFNHTGSLNNIIKNQELCLSYVDNNGTATARYPYNPNGSINGATGFTTTDGRITIMMPHPERVFRNIQLSYNPMKENKQSPWLRMFQNARNWII